jgi:hypothetical protein
MAWQTESRQLREDASIIKSSLGTNIFILPSHQGSHKPRSLFQRPKPSVGGDNDDEEVMQNGNLDLIIMPCNRGVDEGPTMYAQIGGLREDPFGAFPIECQGYVPSAFDYCEHVEIIPSNFVRKANIVYF